MARTPRPNATGKYGGTALHLLKPGCSDCRQFEDGRWRNKVARNVYARRVGRNHIPYWAHIKIPALLMRGDRSNRVSPQIVAQVRALAPQVQVAKVADCDHHVTLDNPPGFVEVCKQWIACLA